MANIKNRMLTKEVFRMKGGWVRRLGNGKIVGPFKNREEAEKSYSSPKIKQEKEELIDKSIEKIKKIKKEKAKEETKE